MSQSAVAATTQCGTFGLAQRRIEVSIGRPMNADCQAASKARVKCFG